MQCYFIFKELQQMKHSLNIVHIIVNSYYILINVYIDGLFIELKYYNF